MVESRSSGDAAIASGKSLAPHPAIPAAFDGLENKGRFLNSIFDATALDYDRVEGWLSLGSGGWYRRQALHRAGLRPGMRVVDVAVGTGLVAAQALSILGPGGRVIGVDPSAKMRCRAAARHGVETIAGTAEALPFPSASFDFLSMGYALRHVDDLNRAFREFHRVLRSDGERDGGRLCIMEVTRPSTRLGRAALRAHLAIVSRLTGLVSRLAPRTPELWAYYWETIDKCVPPHCILEALANAGFVRIKRHVVCGIFSEFTAGISERARDHSP